MTETPWRRFSRKRVINQTLEKRRVVREWKTNWKMARNGGSSLDEASRTQNQHGISPVKGTSIAEGKKVVSSKVSWTENERVRDVKGKSIVLDDDVVDQAVICEEISKNFGGEDGKYKMLLKM
ncbi:hypothetical protein RYX36_005481 [Vicia faba]